VVNKARIKIMSVKIVKKILTGSACLLALAVAPVSEAAPIIFNSITMDVHSTDNIRVTTGDDATSLLTRFNSGSSICTVALDEFTAVGGKQNCGTSAQADLATLYTIDYALGGGTADFQLGADWGLGGILMGIDGGDVVRTNDIWWANNWNNADVINFSLTGTGSGTLQLLGFENCCSGNNSLRVSIDGGQTYSAVRASTPEPAPLALLGFGLLGLAVSRRRSA